MNDAQHPVIRDPHAPANMVGSASEPDPLAALGPVRGAATGSIAAHSTADDFNHDFDAALDRGLAKLDPLTVRPRISSRVLCAVFGVLMIAGAFGIWWLCVHTENGQSYDEIVWKQLPDNLPGWASGVMGAVAQSWLVITVSCVLGAMGIITALIRRRWWLAGQLVVFAAVCLAATQLKGLLPRPFIIQTESPVTNSAPSGHTMLAAAAAVVLIIAVPRAARALAAVVGGMWTVLVGVSVMVGQWHRTSDVLMSILLVAGLALIVLVFTRKSGMDDPGSRVSSVSVQIVGSVLITGGILLMAYSAYVIWQVLPGLNVIASWAVQGATASAVVGIIGITALAFGILLALRHITAAPLSRLGLIGAPPAPPMQDVPQSGRGARNA
ncbi:phosphatase PAP2 family protein [Bifidobacterium sp. LC6]|uniref:Phosphatase PAP2 family protein n=1 Tax=Bifidobacterium colobi TaxID=2809026 RepID=A0ABS5UT38_9BIFI|nr:phosphatase PAP2 family protein [Bifidobacterium colobi]MBT1174204.1 phosphatase PAP2 family protein [Bifidobacterium colobi]